eukprot:8361799-Ditylum_brightwellii.AAC.1
MVVHDCFWLFEMIKIRLTVILRQNRVQTFTTQNGFNEPLVKSLVSLEDASKDSKYALFWCAA